MNRWMIVCVLFVLLAFAGCADERGSSTAVRDSGNADQATGTLTFTWPSSSYAGTRAAINSATEWFRTKVEEGSSFFVFADLDAPGMSVSLASIPVGPAMIHATAWDGLTTGLPTLLSYGSAAVTVVGGISTPVTVTLAPSSTAFIQPLSLQYSTPTTVEITFTNWPLV